MPLAGAGALRASQKRCVPSAPVLSCALLRRAQRCQRRASCSNHTRASQSSVLKAYYYAARRPEGPRRGAQGERDFRATPLRSELRQNCTNLQLNTHRVKLLNRVQNCELPCKISEPRTATCVHHAHIAEPRTTRCAHRVWFRSGSRKTAY